MPSPWEPYTIHPATNPGPVVLSRRRIDCSASYARSHAHPVGPIFCAWRNSSSPSACDCLNVMAFLFAVTMLARYLSKTLLWFLSGTSQKNLGSEGSVRPDFDQPATSRPLTALADYSPHLSGWNHTNSRGLAVENTVCSRWSLPV